MTGPYAYTPAIWLPLVAVVLLAAIGVYAWRRRDVPGAKPFVAMSAFSILLLLGIAFEAAAVLPATKLAWYRFQFVVLMAAVTPVTCFVLDYAYPGRWLTRRNVALLSIPGLFCLLMALAGDSQLIWRRLELGADGSVMLRYGPAGAIVVAYGLGMYLLYAAVFLRLFIRSPQHRWPVALMLLGQVTSRTLFVLDIARPLAFSPLDLSVFIVVLPWTTYAIAMFGFHILDPLPAARQTVFEQMHAAVVAFDARWQVVSLNPAAERILGLRTGAARGKTWQQLAASQPLLPALPDASVQRAGPATEDAEMTFGSGANARQYATALSPLHDSRGLLIGYLLMLRDVTEQRRAQAQIVEHERSLATLHERERLARELHDSIGQVLGYAGFQVEAAGRLIDDGQTPVARAQLARLGDVLNDAHADVRQQILDLRVAPSVQQPFFAAVQHYLDGFTGNYDIQTNLTVGGGPAEDTFSPEARTQLYRILQEALANARKHGGARRVQVTFETVDGTARMRIKDDGRGFDPAGFDPGPAAVTGRSHFGLGLMRERAEELGGSLRVESAPGQGTSVVVEVPRVER